MRKRGTAPALCAAITLLVLLWTRCGVAAAAADLVFRVPDVVVQHAAADRPVGTARRHTQTAASASTSPTSSTTNSTQNAAAARSELPYQEYFIEHDVSTAEARRAAADLRPENSDELSVGCGACSRRELEYCEARVVADHCCCEHRYVREPFPWLPHTCYVGAAPCRPLAGHCARYARLRDCCCYKRMAIKWKGILSGAGPASGGAGARTPWLLVAAVAAAIHVHVAL